MTAHDTWVPVGDKLHKLWLAGNLADAQTLLAVNSPEHNADPRFRLAQIQQGALEDPDRQDRRRLVTDRERVIEIVSRRPDDLETILVAAPLMLELGDHDLAKHYARHLRGLVGPQYERLPVEHAGSFFYLIASLFHAEGKLQEAAAILEHAITLDHVQPPEFALLAQVMWELGKHRESVAVVRAGLARLPESRQLQLLLSELDGPSRYMARPKK